jgi:hypothetical protein
VTGNARAGKRIRGPGFAMVRYVDADGDEHYAGLAEAAAVPFENGRMARNIPAYRDIAHTPGRYWAATTGGAWERRPSDPEAIAATGLFGAPSYLTTARRSSCPQATSPHWRARGRPS